MYVRRRNVETSTSYLRYTSSYLSVRILWTSFENLQLPRRRAKVRSLFIAWILQTLASFFLFSFFFSFFFGKYRNIIPRERREERERKGAGEGTRERERKKYFSRCCRRSVGIRYHAYPLKITDTFFHVVAIRLHHPPPLFSLFSLIFLILPTHSDVSLSFLSFVQGTASTRRRLKIAGFSNFCSSFLSFFASKHCEREKIFFFSYEGIISL